MKSGIHEDALRVMLEGGAVVKCWSAGTAINGAWPFAWAASAVAGCRYARGAKRCAPGPSHPATLFISLFTENAHAFVIEKLGGEFDAFLEKFTYSAYFCGHVYKFETAKALLLTKFFNRAGSSDFQTANSFIKNASDIEKSMGNSFLPVEAFTLIINIIQAANWGAFAAVDMRNASFGTILKFKKLANDFLNEQPGEAKVIAAKLLHVKEDNLDAYFDFFKQTQD